MIKNLIASYRREKMNALEAIAKRKSTRSDKSEQVSDQVLETILKAGFAAPVAMAKYDSLHVTVLQLNTRSQP